MSKASKLEVMKRKIQTGATPPPHLTIMEPVGGTDDNTTDNTNVNVNIDASARKRKPKFEERYSRSTFYMKNELLNTLNEKDTGEKGFKTKVMNDALEDYMKNRGWV